MTWCVSLILPQCLKVSVGQNCGQGAENPQACVPGPFWASVSPPRLSSRAWPLPAHRHGAGGCCVEREGEAPGDRNLASLSCPPRTFLHPGPLARWGLPAPDPGTAASRGLNFSLWWVSRRGPDTLHFPISGNKSCGALYCQVEKSRCKTQREKTPGPRCIAAPRRR